MLSIQILWREYLAISCRECRDIKLVDLETKEITKAYKDGQPFGKMCRGWHKICVRLEQGYLQLDCSSTKFTKMRYTETGNDGFISGYDLCYVPPPLNTIVTIGGGGIRATSLDEQPNETVRHLFKKEMDGKIIKPNLVTYSSRLDAVLVMDGKNKTVWVINPGSMEILQNIDVSEITFPMNAFIWGSQFIIVSKDLPARFKIYNFSLN